MVSERIDLAIRFGKLQDSSSIAFKLVDLNYVVCCSPGYLKKNTRPKNPSDIEKHDCLSFLFPKFNLSWKFQKTNSTQEIFFNSKISMTSALSLIELAKKGEGLALLPDVLIKEELEKKKLINLFPSYKVTATEFGTGIYLVYPSRDYLPLKTRALLDYIKEKFKR